MFRFSDTRKPYPPRKKALYMRIVIKVGTSTLTHQTGNLNIRHTEQIVKVLSDLKNAGHELILVSSGAIGMGVGKLGLTGRPDDMAGKQACAAVGQCELMYVYDKLFSEYNHTIAQILMTGEDFKAQDRFRNFENTMDRLLALGVLPVINENDTVSTQEIAVGDNDTLAAIVARGVGADLLVLLSDIDGLYSEDPHKNKNASLIRRVEVIDDAIRKAAGGETSALGTGGMATKIAAAELCMENGIDMIIMNGQNADHLYSILGDSPVGTLFCGKERS